MRVTEMIYFLIRNFDLIFNKNPIFKMTKERFFLIELLTVLEKRIYSLANFSISGAAKASPIFGSAGIAQFTNPVPKSLLEILLGGLVGSGGSSCELDPTAARFIAKNYVAIGRNTKRQHH